TNNAGTITLQNDVMTGITFNGATLTNTGTIDFQTNQGINTTMGTPILTNLSGGIIKKSVGGGSAVITFPVDNQAGGTIQVQTGTSTPTISCSASNCLLDGATLQIQAWSTYSATANALVFSNAANLTLDPGQVLFVTNDGDFVNGGGAASSIVIGGFGPPGV